MAMKLLNALFNIFFVPLLFVLFVCIHGGISTVCTAMNTGEDFSTCNFFRLVKYFYKGCEENRGLVWRGPVPFGVPIAQVLNVLAVCIGTLLYTVVQIVAFLEGTIKEPVLRYIFHSHCTILVLY